MDKLPFNPFKIGRNVMIAGVAGGVAGAVLWKSHRVIGFVLGSLGVSLAASAYFVGDAASDVLEAGVAATSTPTTSATWADTVNDTGVHTGAGGIDDWTW